MSDEIGVKDVRKDYKLNVAVVKTVIAVFAKPVMKYIGAEIERYTPKNKTFILISNHSDPLDPGFEMYAINRYMRFVAADHIARAKVGGWLITKLGGAIIKHREKPSSVLTDEILENLKAGIPVGIHAEGGTSVNGETGFISEHTGQLVKDSGVALITFRFTGGYLRSPRWSKSNRRGPLYGKVINEYSAQELSKLSVKEITDIIRRDTFVNVYDEQRKIMGKYRGKNLAEYVERILFMCPSCNTIGELHSHDDLLKCDKCGYTVRYGEDAFFHDAGSGLVFDNICDWDKWQIKSWKDIVLSAKDGEKIFEEKGQIIYEINGSEKNLVCDSAALCIYKDSFHIIPENGDEKTIIPFDKIKKVQLALKDSLLLIDDKNYFEIRCGVPRAASKYVAAWRFLTGRDYF